MTELSTTQESPYFGAEIPVTETFVHIGAIVLTELTGDSTVYSDDASGFNQIGFGD